MALLSSTGSSAGATGTGAGAGTGGGAARAKVSLTHPSQPQRRRWVRPGGGGGGDDSDDEAAHEASGEPRVVDASRSLWAAAVHNKADAFASHERPIEDVKEVVVQAAAPAADGAAALDGSTAAADGTTQPLQTQTQTVLLVPQGITISSTAGGKGLLATRTGPLAPVDRFTLGGGTYQYSTPPAPAPGGGGGGTAVAGSSTTTTTVTAGAARPKYRNAPAPVASSSSASSSSATAQAAQPWQEPAAAPPPANIHFDKRVARGLTCTVKPVASDGVALTADEQKRVARERSQARIAEHLAHREYLLATGQIRPQLQAVAYLHENIVVPKVRVAVDTTVMLTEPLATVPLAVADTQTDAFESPPPSPKYRPRKTGVDKHTQVDNAHVFAFDEEVSAILEVLSTKTLEQALTEVREEEELRHVRALKRDVEARNAAEAARIAEMERAERAVVAAKDAIIKRSHQTVARERTVQNKIFAMRFARAYVSTLQSDVFGSLERAQYLFDPATHQTERFLPALYAHAQQNVDAIAAARTFADTLLSASLQRVQDAKDEQAAAQAAEAARARAAAEEVARRRAPIQLYLTCVAVSPDPVGPIALTGESTVANVQDAVVAWMSAHLPNAPARSALRFLWGGRELNPDQTLHGLGVQTLGTMQMRVEKDAVQLELDRMNAERAAKAAALLAAQEEAAKREAEDDAKAAADAGDAEPEDD